ncbi:MAG: 2-dehydro-3-deoxygluconokinase/2-dehydro-3-deoxygalactonokinase [Methanosaeta sp. PtaU1.Bin060]|nr:MAG: 2-dehydro-3-deoxygluconokinase/2-dehydro-3-deoxygalactonokinase [Methanosaeta sp. PtaU1.Bin060]
MIYTITLNPALDRTIWIDRIRDDVSNRILEEKSFAGGKSIDVSKVLKNFGVENTALGFVGGFAGRELEGRLLNDGIQSNFVRVSGETRTNIVIHERETGRQIVFNARGPEIRPSELMQFVELIEDLPCADVVTIGGSLPLGVSPEIYRKIITLVKRCPATVALDVDGAALKVGIQARPNVIKPNIHELSELVGRELTEIGEILAAAREVNGQGVEIVLVSMGGKGILLVADGKEYLGVPPAVKVESTVGAGDSSVAGFISGLVRGKDLKQCLKYAVAAGTATTLQQGTALCQMKDFQRIVAQVSLQVLKG